jgi:ketosteroid isomerase-like protein
MPTGSSVRKATLADAPRLAQALAAAFQDDPVIAWIFPDQQRRRAVLPAFIEFRLRKLAFPHDRVWMTADGAAAAVWLRRPGDSSCRARSGCGCCRPWSGSLVCGPPRSCVGWSV